MKEKFIDLLKSTKRKGMDDLIEWLEKETDFFKAPASSKYHLSFEGGLLRHSLNVYEELIASAHITPKQLESAKIVSLLHDICKVNYYKKGKKNIKNSGGKWEEADYYFTDDQFSLGHGEKSVILIQRFIHITDEEIMAIRWHMGGYEPKDNYNYLNKAFSEYELALELHIADLRATYILEK